LFATYGYGGAYGGRDTDVAISPFFIPQENTWGLEAIRFTREEYEEYFRLLWEMTFSIPMSQEDVAHLKSEVWRLTRGHPGLISFICNQFYESFTWFKHSGLTTARMVSRTDIFQFFNSNLYALMTEVS
jgi:hypothetical protein